MTWLRTQSARLIALCLALAIFVGGVGMYAPAASNASPAIAHHAALQDPAAPRVAQASHACPSESTSASQSTHGDCAMVICCFSQIDSPRAVHIATILPADYGSPVDPRLPQADPERSDKPPKHT